MKKTIKRIIKKAKGAGGTLPVFYQKYNNTLGYFTNEKFAKYLQENRAIYQKSNDKDKGRLKESEVHEKGTFLVESVLAKNEADALSQRISDLKANNQHIIEKEETKNLSFQVEKPVTNLGRALVDIFSNEELDYEIKSFFGGSYYRVEWLNCYRSFPSNEAKSSWLWHSDNVPSSTLKVMLHITDAGSDRGATRFISIPDTMDYRSKGYFGLQPEKRVEDLKSFAEANKIPYRPYNYEAKAGDVLLFLNNTLHRAIPPVSEHRDVVTYLLLPNPIPWDQQLEKDGYGSIEDKPGNYPKNPRKN